MSYTTQFPVIKKDFAARLRAAREKSSRKLSKMHVARLIEVDRNTIARWEDPEDKALPNDLIKFNKLCELLGVSPQYLMNGTKEWELTVAPEHREFIKLFYTRYRLNSDYLYFIKYSMILRDEVIEAQNILWQESRKQLKDIFDNDVRREKQLLAEEQRKRDAEDEAERKALTDTDATS
ncbi:helix-turn-helix domain-containing protein [Alkalimarinus sediminis]|uniref:Helix-turn-helix transcriptional regulator n=1 Tax=Alkalimarinus sediminis TaxID=1632866 RepID=A0A9E8KKP6_9ALTE|nr:helix-turn-helix transcriptional regulator [Alkalimarinus sediminis]UZW76401.1 helix-turn-helix transcriptional regulator [Alkalimarinus sediminis]